MRTLQRLLATSLCLFASSLPSAWAQTSTQVQILQPMTVYSLPGALDDLPMLNSNSPEIVQQPGILVSTLSGFETEQCHDGYQSANCNFLDYSFKGDFGVFAHHIAKDEKMGDHLLYLGLLATNNTDKPVKLTLKGGASYLSQPDALTNNSLPGFMPNPMGLIYTGVGDRVATEIVAGKGFDKESVLEIAPYSSQLVYNLPIPTQVAIPPALNGRSTLMYFQSDGPVYLSHLAAFATKSGSTFTPPTQADYQALLDAHQYAGPRETTPTEYDPADPPPQEALRYGRVSGISQGLHWKGQLWQGTRILERPAVGQRVAYPISSTYLKRFGTTQNQSGSMFRRNRDTAYQATGNYGVHYELQIPLHNTGPEFASYSLAINHPAKMNGTAQAAEMLYLYPPNKQVMFRGSVRLRWTDEYNQKQDQLTHLLLRDGDESQPLAMITVPPKTNYDLKLDLVYPADATPPQLLSIARIQ